MSYLVDSQPLLLTVKQNEEAQRRRESISPLRNSFSVTRLVMHRHHLTFCGDCSEDEPESPPRLCMANLATQRFEFVGRIDIGIITVIWLNLVLINDFMRQKDVFNIHYTMGPLYNVIGYNGHSI